MEITAVKNHIKTKNPDSMYIFSGTELEIQRIYINKLAECKGLEVVRVDSIKDIFNTLKNPALIKNNYCYVMRDDKEFMQNEELQNKIESYIGNNILIWTLTSVDKRLKFYKRYKDRIVEFNPLESKILHKYIKKEIDLSDSNCDKLIEICENDYGRILLEIDKIKTYIHAERLDDIDDHHFEDSVFRQFVEKGVIYQPPKDAIFDFVDAVLRHNVNRAYEMLDNCRRVGEATLVMLSVLYTNAKQLLQVQSCQSNDISKSTGLTAWQIKCVKDKCGIYRDGDLVYLMELIQKVEVGIKTGRIEEEFAVDYVLANIM